MPAEKSPAFQFYPKDFLSSDAVSLMTTEQVGAYMMLLCHSWLRPEGLPVDTASLSKLARVPLTRFTSKVWPVVSRSFQSNPDGLLYNPRLERSRDEQEAYKTERSQSGKRGAKARWGMAQPSNGNGSAINQPLANDSSSSSSSSAVPPLQNSGGRDTPPPPMAQPLHGRRNPDRMTHGPLVLWASWFRDDLVPLVSAAIGGDRDVAYQQALEWVGEVDSAASKVPPSRVDLANPRQFWLEKARARWASSASEGSDLGPCPQCGAQGGRCVDIKICNANWLASKRASAARV